MKTTMENDLFSFFKKLPESAQKEIFHELSMATKWRGWDALPPLFSTGMTVLGTHAAEHVKNIADIFEANGVSLSEFT